MTVQLTPGVSYKVAYKIGRHTYEDTMVYIDKTEIGLTFNHPRPFTREIPVNKVVRASVCKTMTIPLSSIVSAKEV